MSKFCANCGKELKGAKFCPDCGTPAKSGEVVENTYAEDRYDGFAITGFVIALVSLIINFAGLVGVIATVFSAIGMSHTGDDKLKGRGMAVAGLIIGIISIFWGLFQILTYL